MAARGEKPEWVPIFGEDANMWMPPFWDEVDPETGTDFLNIKWVENDAGKMPDENWQAMEDITQWREVAKFPDLSKLNWEKIAADFFATADADKVNIAMLNTSGLFLIPINMVGWEDGLCAIYEEPDELDAFVSAIADFLIELAGYVGTYLKPDIMFSGDDVASATGPFISHELWVERYKPYFKKVNDAIHAQGALAEFHCCGNCQYLIEEFIDIGTDICQLPMPNEALLEDKKRFGDRLVLTGGWDRTGAAAQSNAPEDVVRESAHIAIDTWGKEGGLIFWDGGIIGSSEDSKRKMDWLYDEVREYGSRVYQD